MNVATHVASLITSLGSIVLLIGLGGCPGPRAPSVPAARPLTLAIGREGGTLRGVAGDGAMTFAAITSVPPDPAGALAPGGSADPAASAPASTTVEARRGDAVAWKVTLAGSGGPIASTSGLLVATLTGNGSIGSRSPGKLSPRDLPVRGEPGAALVALDATTGAARWRTSLDASEWCVVAAIAAAPDGVIVGGSFAGSLRIRDHVVASGGRSDGFVAKLTATGDAAWLVRVGGSGPDAVQGVAVRGPRVAIAGTFAAGADLLGQELPAFDDKSPYADAFVGALDTTGARVWSATFGGKLAETVAGVAIDDAGRVVIAANARDIVHIGGADLAAQGLSDGLVAWWTKDGTASHAVLLGGADFDGLRAITAIGERIVVGGFYSGEMPLGDRAIAAGGGDDAFLAALDARGVVVDRWEVGGVGREEVTSLASVPGGFIAGIAYTAAARVAGVTLPAPKDPLGGSVVVVRPVR